MSHDLVSSALEIFPGSRLVREPRKMRPYQEAQVNRVRAAFAAGKKAVLMQAPVGSGKGDVIAFMAKGARARGLKVAIVTHRREIIDELCRRLDAWECGEYGVIRADDYRTNPAALLQVCSVQTLFHRPLADFDLILWDEAHRCAATSYRKVKETSPNAMHVGASASPLRTDGTGLDTFFDHLDVGPQPSELIALGKLAKPRVYTAPIQVQVTRTEMGTVEALGEIMSAPRIVGSVWNEYARLAEGRAAFGFAASVEHSKKCHALFQEKGVHSAHVDSSTEDSEREAAISGLDSGALDIVWSYGLNLEGVNVERAKLCLFARPTSSLVVWLQGVGRVLRPWRGVVPTVCDFGGNTERLGSCVADREWSLDGTSRTLNEPNAYHVCLHCFAYVLSTHPCEICGADAPSRQERQIEADESVRLEEILEDDESKAKRQVAHYSKMVMMARARGRSPKFAGMCFKKEFGFWPKEWVEATEAKYANDEDWRQRYEANKKKTPEDRVPEAWSDE